MTKEDVCKLLSSQKLISLGTAGKVFPYNSMVCFSYDGDCISQIEVYAPHKYEKR